MFIQDEDYKVVIGEASFKVLSQDNINNRDMAERDAIEEMSGYLRPRYDVEKIFSKKGNERNSLLVMYACDIALYHMTASMPGRMGAEIRRERYERAIKWFEGVSAGKIVPDLPIARDSETGNNIGSPIIFGGQKQRNNNW